MHRHRIQAKKVLSKPENAGYMPFVLPDNRLVRHAAHLVFLLQADSISIIYGTKILCGEKNYGRVV
jgi:hypothetical protein